MRAERRLDALTGGAILLVLLFSACFGSAQSPPASHAQVELIADSESKGARRALEAGILFHLDPGWHIYWQNAGDSGEPPKIEWKLPAGYRASAIEWPAPKRLGSGSIVDYGYENQVLLIAPIESSASATGNLQLAAEVKYIVCREVCIPGRAHLTLSLPNTNAAQAREWHELLGQARKQLPAPVPAAWKISARAAQNNLILTVAAGSRPTSAVFFPQDANVIENSAPQLLATDGDGFHLTLRVSDQAGGQPAQLKGVLVLDETRAYQIAARVASK